jgi:hypothetical protein
LDGPLSIFLEGPLSDFLYGSLSIFSSPGQRPCELLSWVSVRPFVR